MPSGTAARSGSTRPSTRRLRPAIGKRAKVVHAATLMQPSRPRPADLRRIDEVAGPRVRDYGANERSTHFRLRRVESEESTSPTPPLRKRQTPSDARARERFHITAGSNRLHRPPDAT